MVIGATPQAVAEHLEALRADGHRAPTRATSQHFGISEREVRRRVEAWRLSPAGRTPPPLPPAAAPPAAPPAAPAAAPAAARRYRSDAARKLVLAQRARERDITKQERAALVAALLADELPPPRRPTRRETFAEVQALADELAPDAGRWRESSWRRPVDERPQMPGRLVALLLLSVPLLALALWYASSAQSWPEFHMVLLPPAMATRAPTAPPAAATAPAGAAPLPWQVSPTVEPPTVEPPTAEPPTVEPPTAEPPTVEPPTAEPPPVPTPGCYMDGPNIVCVNGASPPAFEPLPTAVPDDPCRIREKATGICVSTN